MAKGMKGFGNWMTKAINNIDGVGWGRSGAAAGAVAGGVYGGFSDNSGVIGGAAKGSMIGFGGGKLARFGSSFKGIRKGDQIQAYADTSMANKWAAFGMANEDKLNAAKAYGLDALSKMKAMASSNSP